jgi:hypothetical protein
MRTTIIFLTMADAHIISMCRIGEERFRQESNVVFYYEGFQVPLELYQRGNPGDIFAFRGIGGPEVERRLYVKTFPTARQQSHWEEVQDNVRHPKKFSYVLALCRGLPFWPKWDPVGRVEAKIRRPLNLGDSFDVFFRFHANVQDPLIIELDEENESKEDSSGEELREE